MSQYSSAVHATDIYYANSAMFCALGMRGIR